MQRSKNAPYVEAGMQETPGVRFNVRSSVHLPDSEAGQIEDDERRPYRAEHVRVIPRESPTVPLREALVFLCALFVVFGGLIIGRAVQRSDCSKKIDAMKIDIEQTKEVNKKLAAEVEQARDPARISNVALSNLDMKAPTRDTTEHVTAPDTRPFENKTATQAEVSPHAALDGMITGSR